MKLHIVPARQGVLWVKLGIQTFFRQPLALSGLFFMCAAILSLFSLVPLVGGIAASVLLPGATLGLMAASREAGEGKFPMPSILLTAFRAAPPQVRAILFLGVLYSLALATILGACALIDGGKFAKFFVLGGPMTAELLQEADFQSAALAFTALYLPISMLFWHAPALVHWHGIPPVKSLFFSLVACLRNMAAFMVYSVTWAGVFILMGILVATIAALTGKVQLAATLMYPAVMILTAVLITSIYFTFRDNFETRPGDSA
ncbi:MAG: hypothetical protein IPH37_04675 [Burkholderiales bacterium]|nr:hypothetical protein [Burkholderiales bacterium]MBK9345559.1 hypothetical protein [Burkholderiales bacterium]MBP8053943.1 hypothetical protein [Burkholderiaceae bacterium]